MKMKMCAGQEDLKNDIRAGQEEITNNIQDKISDIQDKISFGIVAIRTGENNLKRNVIKARKQLKGEVNMLEQKTQKLCDESNSEIQEMRRDIGVARQDNEVDRRNVEETRRDATRHTSGF
jgi:ABC-type ATPase involved in cell division